MDVLLGTADDISAGLVVSTHDPRIAGRLPTRWRMRDGRLTDVPVGAPS
jgi:putative ABC transport system ATP-binding protein